MNNHLHLLEAYTTLAQVAPDPRVAVRLRALLELMLDRIVNPRTGHQILFFDELWRPMSQTISDGHDVETSWLMCEAAGVLGDPALVSRAQATAVRMADAVLDGGYDAERGGLYLDRLPDGHVNTYKDWWPQAEAVVGFLNAFELSGRAEHLAAALKTWEFIVAHVLDREAGEWHTRVSREGVPEAGLTKVGFWKCPYHDTRAMLEIVERTHRLEAARSR